MKSYETLVREPSGLTLTWQCWQSPNTTNCKRVWGEFLNISLLNWSVDDLAFGTPVLTFSKICLVLAHASATWLQQGVTNVSRNCSQRITSDNNDNGSNDSDSDWPPATWFFFFSFFLFSLFPYYNDYLHRLDVWNRRGNSTITAPHNNANRRRPPPSIRVKISFYLFSLQWWLTHERLQQLQQHQNCPP